MTWRTPYTFSEAYFDTLSHTNYGSGIPDLSQRVNDLLCDTLDRAESLGWEVQYEHLKGGEEYLGNGRLACVRPYGIGEYTTSPLQYTFEEFRGAVLNVSPKTFEMYDHGTQVGILAHEVSHVEKFLRDGEYNGEEEPLFIDLCSEIGAAHPSLDNEVSNDIFHNF